MAEQKEKVESVVKELFTAQLEMTAIHPKVVRFRVTGHKGLGVLSLHHIEMDRANFPKDDDFNMDFINMDLPTDLPKTVFKRQASFRMYKNLAMNIFTV